MGARAAVALTLLALCASAGMAQEGQRADSLLLNGQWEFALGQGMEGAELPANQAALQWKPVTLPGPFLPWSNENSSTIRFVWARRSFTLSAAQAAKLAVLRWNRISFGATAYLNGRKAGENAPTGPYQTLLPPGLLKEGRNEIVLLVPGILGVPKAASGALLIPAGFATGGGQGMPEVRDDVWLDFADGAYVKWMLALPDLAGGRVRVRVTPTALTPRAGLKVAVEVRSWPEGKLMGVAEAPTSAAPQPDPVNGPHTFVDVPMPGYRTWTPETPQMYAAKVTLSDGSKRLDEASFRFGMREITVSKGDYKLNGRTVRFRGSELCFEWDWGTPINGHEKEYLVTEAAEMSHNAFRTHTQPLPRVWADICDENGLYVLSEFPVLYNYQDYRFTPQEYAAWHRNVLSDAVGWMARLWNHPSVVTWVLSNESLEKDRAWETGTYHDFVKALDPTRPTMRTGESGTAENYDVHACGNVTDTEEGLLLKAIPSWLEAGKGRTVTNSEYMNAFGAPVTQWNGTTDKDAEAVAIAQLGMEHTEAMRRARLDAELPYMYAGFGRTRWGGRVWKGGYGSPMGAAWHSALSPVLASLDLFNADYLVGQKVTTDLHLINDSWQDADVTVDLLLTRDCPEFIPESPALGKPLARWSYRLRAGADSVTKVPVTWELPREEGSYWLTARTTGIPGRPVLSQRFVRALRPAPTSPLGRRTVAVLGSDPSWEQIAKDLELRNTTGLPDELKPAEHVVLVWNAERLTAADRETAPRLAEFAARGGRVVVLAAPGFAWKGLVDLTVGGLRGSRAFIDQGVTHPILEGLGRDWMVRWNGLPGNVSRGQLQGADLTRGKTLAWVQEPKSAVLAEVPSVGGGAILVTTLDLPGHAVRSRQGYDPAAERVLVHLLGGASSPTPAPGLGKGLPPRSGGGGRRAGDGRG